MLVFALDGWFMALCLWLAVRVAEGRDEPNPPLLALAIGFGTATATALFGSLGMVSSAATFVLLITVYRLSMPAALLTCVLLVAIGIALALGLAALATGAGPLAALGFLIFLIVASLRWWRHDLRLLVTWLRQGNPNARAKPKAPRPVSPKRPRVPKAEVRSSPKPIATEQEQSSTPGSPSPAPTAGDLPDKPSILR